MANSVPHGSSGAPPLGSYTSTPGAGSAMFRRSSYASVVSGAAAPGGPQRSGTFSPIVNNNSTSGQPPQHPSINHSRNTSRNSDADGHHNGMSASWGRGGHLPSYSSQFGCIGNGLGGLGPEGSASSFFVPSYLRGSRHAERLEEAHKAKIAAQREYRSNHSSNAGSLSTSSSSVNLHKMVPSHRGMTHDIIERAPVIPAEEAVAPWPTKWSDSDKYPQLDIQPDGLEVRFSGSGKTHDESASIRTDYPMPRQCGIYYFEVTVVSKGKEGRMIGIGVGGPKVVLNRIPGWEPDSWAYHGDDGNIFSSTTSGKAYGPKFSTLDVIGCGVNFRTGCIFFTKNGHYIDVAFSNIKQERLYPMVGMKKPGEILRANFGQTQFVFDIDNMVEKEKAIIQDEINKHFMKDTSSFRPPLDETSFIHELIAQYLAHDGYVETARAFAGEVREELRSLANGNEAGLKYLDPEEDQDAVNRQRIRASILDGDVDRALKLTTAFYPSVLRDNENIYFKLRCRKFIEMIRKYTELQHSSSSKRANTANGHHNTSDDYDVFDHQMELDDQFGPHTGQWAAEGMDTEGESGGGDYHAKYENLLEDTIRYGQELKSEFSGDPRREVKKALEDTFALIAYPDARESSLAPLLEISGRVPVAEELNSAILVSLGKSSSAALERLCQQTEALVDELSEDGGAGAFINVRRDFLQ